MQLFCVCVDIVSCDLFNSETFQELLNELCIFPWSQIRLFKHRDSFTSFILLLIAFPFYCVLYFTEQGEQISENKIPCLFWA